MVIYVLAYGGVRSGGYLVHRQGIGGDGLRHRITTGDAGQMTEGWWFTTTHTIPWWVFSPLRWMEAAWWERRDPWKDVWEMPYPNSQ